jgi:tripartite-type tricarboxylate transporter receptor subunit TctC
MKTFVCRRVFFIAIVMLLTAGFAARAAAAEPAKDYPSRPIRMVIPFAPGGASDFAGRIIQPKLSEELNQRIVIDNRSGAAGNIGVEIAARAAPDGYTLLLGNIGTMAINPGIYPQFPIKPTRDLIAISLVADVPGAFGVHPSIPVATVQEFVAYARARPGQLNYGSAGVTSAQRLLFEVFMKKTGIQLNHIPFKEGAGGATIALLGGQVAATIATVASYVPHVKTGRIKVIAVVAPKRVKQLPDTPTFAEQGFPDWTIGSWSGVFVPARTPKPVVDRLFTAVSRTVNDPGVIERINAGGAEIASSRSPAEFAKFLREQTALWAQTIKDTGATAE